MRKSNCTLHQNFQNPELFKVIRLQRSGIDTIPDPGYQWESDKLTEDMRAKRSEDHKAHINRRAQNIANTRQNKNIKDPQKKYRLGTVSKIFYWRA